MSNTSRASRGGLIGRALLCAVVLAACNRSAPPPAPAPTVVLDAGMAEGRPADAGAVAPAEKAEAAPVYAPGSVHVLTGPSDKVTGVAWSPDGKQLASAGADRLVRIFVAETGVMKHALPGLAGKAKALVWSPEGTVLVASDDAGTIAAWSVDGTPAWTSHLPAKVAATSLAFAPDSKQVVAGCTDGALRVLETKGGASGRVMKAGNAAITTVAWSRDGKFMASADPSVRIWNAESGQQLRVAEYPKEKPDVSTLTFAPDSRVLAGGTVTGPIQFWTVLDGKRLVQLDAHTDRVTSLSYNGSGEWLVSSSLDQRVRLWNMNTGTVANEFVGHRAPVGAVQITADATRILSGGDDGSVRIWSTNSGQMLRRLAGPSGPVAAMAQLPGQNAVVTLTAAGDIALWDLTTGVGRWQQHAHSAPARELVVTPDGRYIITSGGLQSAENPDSPPENARADVKMWDPKLGIAVRDLGAHSGVITALALSGDGRTLVSAADLGKGGDILLWDVSAAATKARVGGALPPVRALAYASGAALFASGGSDGTVQIIDPSNTVTRQTLHAPGAVRSVALSTDGQLVAVASEGKDGASVVQLWEVAGGKLMRTLSGEQGKVSRLSLSADGWYLLSTSTGPNGGAHLWALQTGEAMGSVDGTAFGGFTAGAFAPDVHNIALAAADGSIRLWVAR